MIWVSRIGSISADRVSGNLGPKKNNLLPVSAALLYNVKHKNFILFSFHLQSFKKESILSRNAGDLAYLVFQFSIFDVIAPLL